MLPILESMAALVHDRLCNQALQAPLAAPNPFCIVRLRDLDAGVAKEPRNVLELHPV